MNKAYKYRIYPNSAQEKFLKKSFGCNRFVFNYFLARTKEEYETSKKTLKYKDWCRELVALKSEKDFLKEADSISLQQSLRHLDTAFQNFFRSQAAGYPRFKSKHDHHFSYTTVCVNNNIKLTDNKIRLPKIGDIRIKLHRQIPANCVMKSVNVSLTPAGRYYVSICCEYEPVTPASDLTPIRPDRVIGLDYSPSRLFVDSNGTLADYSASYRKIESIIGRQQRILSRMKKGSRNYNRQRKKLAKYCAKAADQRNDLLHKLTRQITNACDAVCIEDLDIKAMEHGKYRLGKSICDTGWNMFSSFLAYKLTDAGKKLVKVDRYFPSSQKCSLCGTQTDETKDLSVREWVCKVCGSHHDRDINAAINIRNEGLRLLAV